jgi:ubiquinol-cytochrome c reductase iron-sulfur subunit
MTVAESSRRSRERRMSAVIFICLAAASLAGAGWAVVYWTTGDNGAMGAFLGASLLLAATGLVLWSHHLLPNGPYYEELPEMQSPPAKEAQVLATLDRGGVGRRKLLLGSLGAFGVTVGAGGVSVLRSLGPAPNSLSSTVWRERLPLVDSDGKLVTVGDLPVGGELSVYPRGYIEQPQVGAMLIQLPAGANHPLPGRESWAPHDMICYSKVCSHAGCPVSLYDRLTMNMECPCHQSTFAVRFGAVPIFGPAAGSLAQLPFAVDPDGTLRSAGDFSQPPGPVFWHYDRHNA